MNNNDDKMPTGNPLMVVYRFMGSTHSLNTLTKNEDVEYESGVITFHLSGKSRCEITFHEKFMPKSNKSRLEQFFVFLMCKIAKEAVVNGKLEKDTIEFKISELIDIGMFTDYRNAKKSVIEMSRFIKNIGVDLITPNKQIFSAPIHDIEIDKGNVKVTISRRPNWDKLTKSFLPLDGYAYGVSPTTFRLLGVIYEYLRLNAAKLDAEEVDIPLAYIADRVSLNLDSQHAKRSFKTRIEDPISEICKHPELGLWIYLDIPTERELKKIILLGKIKVSAIGEIRKSLYKIKSGKQTKKLTETSIQLALED